MSLTAFRGRCPNCGHDHGENPFDVALGVLTPTQQAQLDEQFANYAKQKPHLYGDCVEVGIREQVATLTKERDIKEHCIVQLEAEDLRMKAQLAAAKMYQPCQRSNTPHVPVKAIGPCDYAKWGIIETDEEFAERAGAQAKEVEE